ncbi:hypothetical protein [Phaeodactylibacter xiamenensis]|uniref:hypothetical protein n=1 Tax=Phaeodactylibacter xiamenensis TaxID=1524460 RepID=UPI0024A7EF43|nr:hypothetical protein [Phaeodactylibacter xiamenensis]
MIKHTLFLIILICASVSTQAQETDLRFGVGGSFLGSGDMRAIMLENEANLKLNRYFALSGGLGFGTSNDGALDQASFLQLNANVYVSPFRNTGRNDFRLGTGLSWYTVSESYNALSISHTGEIVDSKLQSDQRNALGFSLIIENTYSVTERLLVGLKAFTQPYQNGDINSGILLKFGVKL